MSWDQLDDMLCKFNFSLNWKYGTGGDDAELKALLTNVFHILQDQDERSLKQVFFNCVHDGCPGLTLCPPNENPDLPCEIKFTVHPAQEEFCVSKIVILSQARNLELYINDSYEKSSQGMLTMNEERKLSLFEAEFDLSSYTETLCNATIKLLSFPCKTQMVIQAVMMKVEKCLPIASNGDMPGVDLHSVRRFLGSVGKPLSEDAQKMLQSIENYQKSPVFKAQQLITSHTAILQNTLGKRQQEISAAPQEITRGGCVTQQLNELRLRDELCLRESNPNVPSGGSRQSEEQPAAGSLPAAASHHTVSGRSTCPRTSSVGFVDTGQLDRTFEINEEQHSRPSRCESCGCHGCISVYNTITTNIVEAEQRILQNMDKRMEELQADMNVKFNTLYEIIKTGKMKETSTTS